MGVRNVRQGKETKDETETGGGETKKRTQVRKRRNEVEENVREE